MNDKLDTRITDYALGELDEAARAEMRKRLADDAAARTEADEIAQLAGAMRRATVRPHASVAERNALLQDIIQAHLETQAERAAAQATAAEAATEAVALPLSRGWSRKALWFGGAAVAASLLWAFTLTRDDESDLAFLPVRIGSSRGPFPTATGGAIQLEAEMARIRAQEEVVERLEAKIEPGRVVKSSDLGSFNGSAVSQPEIKTPVSNPPTSMSVAVGATNVFTQSGSQFGAAVPDEKLNGATNQNRVVTTNPGGLTFQGNNSYTGGTTIAAGAILTLPATPPSSGPQLAATNGITKQGAGQLSLKKFPSLGPSGASQNGPRPADPQSAAGRVATASEANRLNAVANPSAAPQPPTEDSLIALLVERRRMAAMYGASHPKTKEIDARYRAEQARYDEIRRAEAAAQQEQFNTETYDSIVENPFVKTFDTPLSTFSIDVDTASYSNVRRFLNQGRLPPRGAVRIEEFLNYFTYNYPQPKGADPFSITTEAVRCPWNAQNVLVRVGLKGRTIPVQERPATNLVFLVDVSGSMQTADKLPLVRESLKMLVRELGDNDRVAIVVYAGSTGLVLPSTGGHEKQKILDAIGKLEAGGSTNGGAGIQLAYEIAVQNFIKGGVNRVVLATDGDFNVGVTNQSDLVDLIEAKAKTGVFFSGLAYGTGNLKDATLEKLADKGNGNYAYIDTLAEARKVLVEQMSGTLVTIAKDVKVQIEFNPARVEAYRLIGYENRVLAAQDFNDDKKDAGEIGAGHTVTALYEVMPVGITAVDVNIGLPPAIDPLKYQKPQPKPKLQPSEASKANELLTLKLRYKQPDGDESKLIERPVKNDVKDYAKASVDFKFAAAVASFGMQLRDSQYRGTATLDAVLELAQEGIGRDDGGYRREFIELVRKAKELKPQSTQP